MKKILVAVDETKGSKAAFETAVKVCSCIIPEAVVLCYVEKLEGRSFLDDVLLSVSEMSTLKEMLEGTEYQAALDKKARTVLDHYRKLMEEKGITNVKPVIRRGHPAEEILEAAKSENAEMIIIGSRGKRASRLLIGSVSREVVNNSEVPVLIVK